MIANPRHLSATDIESVGTDKNDLHSSQKNYIAYQELPGQSKPKKGRSEKFMNFAHFCEFWCFSLGKQARFTLNFCSGMPPEKFMNGLSSVWFAGATPEHKFFLILVWGNYFRECHPQTMKGKGLTDAVEKLNR